MFLNRILNQCGTDSQENGTCATLIPLFQANKGDLSTCELNEVFKCAPPLSLDDLLLRADEYVFMHQCLIHTVLSIIVHHGGKRFWRFLSLLQEDVLVSEYKIELYKTEVYPLPAMNINELSTSRNAEVIDTILKELHIDTESPTF